MVQVKWVPTAHVLADILTKEMPVTDEFKSFLESGGYALRWIVKDAEQEEHLKALQTATEAPPEGERKGGFQQVCCSLPR